MPRSQLHLSTRLLVATAVALMIVSPAKSEAPPVGIPFISFTVTPNPGTTYDEPTLANSAAVWLQFKHPSVFSNIDVNNDVLFYDQKYNVSDANANELSMALNLLKYDNGLQCVYLQEMTEVLASGVFPLNFTVTNISFHENPSPTVAIVFSKFGTQYSTFFTALIRVSLTFSPSIGTNVSFSISNPNIEVVPSIVTIAYPSLSSTVMLRGNDTGTYLFTGALEGGSDLMLRYDFDVSLQFNTFSTIPPAFLAINEATTPTYAGTVSDPYAVTVPQSFLYLTFAVSVRIYSYPPGLVVSPSTLQMSRRNVPATFTVSGAKGLYSLKYVISPAADGRYFDQPLANTSVLIQRKLNITVMRIPDAYTVNKFFSPVYGGAFSVPITVAVESSPKRLLVVQIVAEDSLSSPSFLTFAPGGVTNFSFVLQSRSTGVKQVSFITSGFSVLDFVQPRPLFWHVWGRNGNCHKESGEESCFHLSGCNWNALLGMCSNRSLPIAISPIPLLFDQEPRAGLFLTLPTAVRRGLIITFDVAARLKFSPSVIELGPGDTVANFSVFPTLLPRDVIVDQRFVLLLSGADANIFVQQPGEARIRSQITCAISGPWSIFVNTNSTPFTITCDTPPETFVTFQPFTVQAGASIQFDIIGGSTDNVSTMTAPNVTSQFIVRSTSSEARMFNISVLVGGPNAFRYAPISRVPLNVLPPGEVNVLPHFVVEAFAMSAPLQLDLSIVPENDINITLTIVNATSYQAVSDDAVWITPNITYNRTKKGIVYVMGRVPGKYYINYTVGGTSLPTFTLPGNSSFNVTDPSFGSAFSVGLELGYQPTTRCRVNVGRDSEFFPGQVKIDKKLFCDSYDNVVLSNMTEPVACSSHRSLRQCRQALAQTGLLCAWNTSARLCVHLLELQGQVIDIAYGADFVLLLTVNRTVWSFGENKYGQLGHEGSELGPVQLPVPIYAIVAGISHALAMGQGGSVYGWGNNNMGQLGRGSIQSHDVVPERLRFPSREVISCLSSGALHSAAVSATGTVYTWGSNNYGQLGSESFFKGFSRAPIALPRTLFDGDSIINLQCGFFHTMVASDVATYSFGRNTQGQLGRPGFDETVPAFPILRAPTPYIPMPQYESAMHGHIDCAENT